jgi:hypothetical protein
MLSSWGVTVVAKPRVPGREAGAWAGAVLSALLLGAAAAMAPLPVVVAGIGMALVGVVAAYPPVAAYLLLFVTPLLAGLDRGVLVPLLRPHEAVAVVLGAGVVAHLILAAARSSRPALSLRTHRVDATILALAVSASVVPLMWMVIRQRQISQDDVLSSLQLWKYFAIFLLVRLTVRTPRQVRTALWITMAATSVVALLGILQALGVAGAQELILAVWSPLDEASDFARNRATSTLGSSFAVADVMVFSMAIAAGLLINRQAHPVALALLGVLFAFGAVAAGQFSGVIGIVVGVFAFGLVTRRMGSSFLSLTAVGAIAGLALQPVIQNRLDSFDTTSGLPPSWSGRLDNLQTYFWPELTRDLQWVTGVRPSARIPAPESWREWIYIESGHTWLLWTGGILLVFAFLVFVAVAMRTVLRIARERQDSVGTAAVASFTALGVMAVLMVLDPHLTLRGSADLSFALLALALSGHAGAIRRAEQGRAAPSGARTRALRRPFSE